MSEEIKQENSQEESKTEEVKEEFKTEISVDTGKTCAALSYIAIGIIWYFVDEKMKKNDFVKFHVKQALGLIIADIVLTTALLITLIGSIALPLLKLVVLVLAVMGIIQAVNGEKKMLPMIGQYSEKYLKF